MIFGPTWSFFLAYFSMVDSSVKQSNIWQAIVCGFSLLFSCCYSKRIVKENRNTKNISRWGNRLKLLSRARKQQKQMGWQSRVRRILQKTCKQKNIVFLPHFKHEISVTKTNIYYNFLQCIVRCKTERFDL